jgi:hypothetical protein
MKKMLNPFYDISPNRKELTVDANGHDVLTNDAGGDLFDMLNELLK